MLCALADLGDVEGAAQLVQLMLDEKQERVEAFWFQVGPCRTPCLLRRPSQSPQEINEHVLGSAIDACKNREPPSASAARCFFQVLVHEPLGLRRMSDSHVFCKSSRNR